MPDRSKPLGFWSLLTLGINGTIGVGIFFAPTEVARVIPGLSGAWVYALAGLAILPVAQVYGQLGKRVAENGGPYVWARLAFGPKTAFFIGWLTYVSSLFSAAAVAGGLSRHLDAAFAGRVPWGQPGWAALCVLSLASGAAAGLRVSAWGWNALTVAKLIPLASLVGLAVAAPLPAPVTVSASTSAADLGRAVLVVVFALQGFEVVPVLAGNTHASRSMPWATIGCLAVCALFYSALQVICARAVPSLADQAAPLVAAAKVYGGEAAQRFVAVGQVVSAVGISFGQFITTPRYLAALGRQDGVGTWVSHEDARNVPQRALWLTTAGVLVFVLREELSSLFALSSVAVLAQYLAAVAALCVLAYRRVEGLDRKHMVWAPLALLGIALTATGAQARELWTTLAVTALGIPLLFVRLRKARAPG